MTEATENLVLEILKKIQADTLLTSSSTWWTSSTGSA